jgi:hypothetical protein
MLNCFRSLSPHLTVNVLSFPSTLFFAKDAHLTEETQPGCDSHQWFYIRYLTQTTKACDGQSPQFCTKSIISHLWWNGSCITPLDTNPKPHLPNNPFQFSPKLRLRPKCYTSLGPHAFCTSKPAYINWFGRPNNMAYSTFWSSAVCNFLSSLATFLELNELHRATSTPVIELHSECLAYQHCQRSAKLSPSNFITRSCVGADWLSL